MRLDLRFTYRPVEDLWCQAIVLLAFEDQVLTSEGLKSVDRKMTGTLTQIVSSSIWSAERGDKLLIATQNAIRSEKLLLYGMGSVSEYCINLLENEIEHVGISLDKIDVNEFGIHIPDPSGLRTKYGDYIEAAVKHITIPYLDKYKDLEDYILKIIFSVDMQKMFMIDKIAPKLKKYFESLPDCSIIVDKNISLYNMKHSELAA